jgi:hypothetical protein
MFEPLLVLNVLVSGHLPTLIITTLVLTSQEPRSIQSTTVVMNCGDIHLLEYYMTDDPFGLLILP